MMGWVKKVDAPPPVHPCKLPKSEREHFVAGSVWECDTCHQRWEFLGVRHGIGAEQGDSWDDWKRLAA